MEANKKYSKRRFFEQWQKWRPSVSVYSLIARARTPIVNPGDAVEIELFLSGYGMPEKHKLNIMWSSPYIIEEDNPGVVSYNIGHKVNPDNENEIMPAFKYFEYPLPYHGVVGYLNKAYFLDLKEAQKREYIPQVISESAYFDIKNQKPSDALPPLLIRLNTSKDASPGDYEVTFAFTYGNEERLLQDYKSVQFHIRNKFEKNQGWIIPLSIIGVGIAFVSLVIAAFGALRQMFGW